MGIGTIAKSFRGGLKPKAVRAYLTPLDIHNNDQQFTTGDDLTRVFQYFPESISDTRGINYTTKIIPGLSHPLYQWTSGGVREISFTAIFTRDRSMSAEEFNQAATGAAKTGETTFIPQNVSSFAAQNSRATSAGAISESEDARNVDIPSAVAWLRSFMEPEYSVDGTGLRSATPPRPFPPRKLILGLPGVRLNWGVPVLPASEMFCIMQTCDVTYQGFFGDGTPRFASVELSFAEIIQVGGRIRPHDASDRRSVAVQGYRRTNKNLRNG